MGQAVSGIVGGVSSIFEGKQQQEQFENMQDMQLAQMMMYIKAIQPVWKLLKGALKGEFPPELLAWLQRQIDAINVTGAGASQKYVEALAGRGVAGGPVEAGQRKLAEESIQAKGKQVGDFETAMVLQALTQMPQIAAQAVGYTTPSQAPTVAGPGTGANQFLSGIQDVAKDYALISALKDPSMYSSSSMTYGPNEYPADYYSSYSMGGV